MIQQWIRNFDEYPLVGDREWVQLRQQRFDALKRWLVPEAIAGLSTILQACLFLFLAGVVVMLWSLNTIMAIALYPDVQSAAKEELDRVVGNRLPMITDREHTPYLNALIKEALRWYPSVPMCESSHSSQRHQFDVFA